MEQAEPEAGLHGWGSGRLKQELAWGHFLGSDVKREVKCSSVSPRWKGLESRHEAVLLDLRKGKKKMRDIQAGSTWEKEQFRIRITEEHGQSGI